MELFQSAVVDRVTGARELPSDIDRLRDSLPRVTLLVEKAEWWRFKSPPIAHLLKELRDAAYDAEDVIAQFDYYQLKQEIEGQVAGQLRSSLISFVRNFVSNTANKVKDVQTKLDSVTGQLESVIRPFGLPDGPNPYGKALQRETSSFVPELVLGRDNEVEMVVKLMLELGSGTGSSNEASSSSIDRVKRRKTGNFPILSIVGIGGMGKTTLAQLIYNDERVKTYYHLRIWVCVSDYFDLKKITKEMIESAKRELAAKGELRDYDKQIGFGENFTNLDSLQQILKEKIASKRCLLVLDDVWHENSRDLESLCNPLRSGLHGSMILVTTRKSAVAQAVGTLDPIELGGLPDGIYWELFKKCAFRSDDICSHLQLEGIGKRIAAKLKGSPLAAKTLGGILYANMTSGQWRNILESELWQLEQGDDGIMVALRLSYQYIPVHLKHCFLICSLFPKDSHLYVEKLGPIWMADGIIPHEKNTFFYDKGHEYFKDLIGKSFILNKFSDTFIFNQFTISKVLHDHMHDLAVSLSLDMCYCQNEGKWSFKNHNSVRHLSVYRKPVELIAMEISRCKKLRSLLILGGRDYEIKVSSSTLAFLFNHLPYLRLLDLSGCQIEELPENIGELKLLFYINLSNNRIRNLPNSLCQLYNLQVVNFDGCPLESFPRNFHNLFKLQLITTEWVTNISSKIFRIGKLTSLESLPKFNVLKKDGHKIEELKNMTRLRDSLRISDLENVEGRVDAVQACLNNKEHLRELTLVWSQETSSRNGDAGDDEGILEGLEPHPNLEGLTIRNYGGRTGPSWLQSEKLPHVDSISFEGCSNIESLEDWFVQHQLLSLKKLGIYDSVNLVSLPLEWIGSSSIMRLTIRNCPLLNCHNNLIFPSSLSFLSLQSCGELDKSLPNCLPNVHSLNSLYLYDCHHVTSLPSQVTHHLQDVSLTNCAELQFVELSTTSTLKNLCITRCPKLTPYDPSTADNEVPTDRLKYLEVLKIDNTSLLKLPFLWNPPHSLAALIIMDSPEERMFTGDLQGWLNGRKNLEELFFHDCPNLEHLPVELYSLVTVKQIHIINCPKIQSLPENGLPPSLERLCFKGCHSSLREQLMQNDNAIEL